MNDERIHDCFPFRKDRPISTVVGYLEEEMTIRTKAIEEACNYITSQVPNKSGSFASVILAFSIGLLVGVISMNIWPL